MANYIFKHSDPLNDSFIVQPGQIDGTMLPGNAALYTNPVSGVSAISSHSSLVLYGQTLVDYGQIIQNNQLYLMEHFAAPTRPLTPVQGQIWYKNAAGSDTNYPSDPSVSGLFLWDGTAWTPILTGAGGGLNMGGSKITNVGAPTSNGDAVTLGYANANYLRLSGGTTTGNVIAASGSYTFNSGVAVSVTNAPSTGLHVTNKTYVDNAVASVSSAISSEASTRASADTTLGNSITALASSLTNYVQIAGDTMAGNLTFDVNSSLVATGGGTGIATFGMRRLRQVGEPSLNSDAATKYYVDTAVAGVSGGGGGGGGGADGVVDSGNFDSVSGVLTLTRTLGLPDVVVTGTMAAKNHSHLSTSVSYNLTTVYPQSLFTTTESGDTGFPVVSLYNVIRTIDQTLYSATRRVRRTIRNGNGSNTTFAMDSYIVGDNKLQVFLDGVKQYANEHGSSTISFTDTSIGLRSVVLGLSGTKSFTITVNGAATTVSITAGTGYTYLQLATDIVAQLAALSIPAQLRVDQLSDHLEFRFESNSSGSGSSVVVSYAAGELFTSISTSTSPVNKSISATYSYTEVGNPGAGSTSITFGTAPESGSVVELLVFP